MGFVLTVSDYDVARAREAFADVADGLCARANPYGALTGLSFLGRMEAGADDPAQ